MSINKINNAYILPFIIMVLTIGALLAYFSWEEYRINKNKINIVFNSETERIENALVNIIDHTEFVMKIIIMQITPNYEDVDYISNILSKYSINPNLNNVLSWTVFSWLDKDLIKKVDSVAGVTIKQSEHSHREFLQLSKKYPGIMHLGAPIFGFTSQRYIIPASIGVISGDNYIGSLTIGFDVIKLSHVLANVVKDRNVYFALVDKNMNIILESSNSLTSNGNYIVDIDNFQNFIKRNNIVFDNLNTVSEVDLINNGNNHYLHRLSKYPFAIYLHYDNQAIADNFWKEITYRIIEVCVIGFVALILVLYIYKREKILRYKAEMASKVALDASQAKTDFLAYTAHELRSPLGFIVTSSEMIMNKAFGRLNDKYLEYIKNIHQAGKELIDFINDLLDEMRIEEGGFQVEFSPVNVENLIRRSVKLNTMNYHYKVAVKTNISKDLPVLNSDPRRLLQVFNNIISNAMKYSPENSVLSIEAKMKKKEMHITFQDQGYGMNEEELKISMAKYGVVKHAETATSVGLGLPLIKHLLEALGAQFIINSSIGKGTKVNIIFPEDKIDHNAIITSDNENSKNS
jgi:signal transduction histidine kinase